LTVSKQAIEIRRLSSSPYVISAADWILKNLDDRTIAEVLAAYLYFHSKREGRDNEFVTYVLSAELPKVATLAAGVSTSLIAGALREDDLRRVLASSLRSIVRRAIDSSIGVQSSTPR